MKQFKLKDKVFILEGSYEKRLATPCQFCSQTGKVTVNNEVFKCPYCVGTCEATAERYTVFKGVNFPFKVVDVTVRESIRTGKYEKTIYYGVNGKVPSPTSHDTMKVCWEKNSNQVFSTKEEMRKYIDNFNNKSKMEAEKKSKKTVKQLKANANLQKPYNCCGNY